MKRIRVLFAHMPKLLLDIVRKVVESAPDMTVAGETADRELAPAAKRLRADVVLVAQGAGQSDSDYVTLLRKRPSLKVLAITGDGKSGTLHEMRPYRIPLGEMSADTLRDAIRGIYPHDAENGATPSADSLSR